MKTGVLLKYLQQGIDDLLEKGHFENGWEFRPTQGEALKAYQRYLNQTKYTDEQKLKGFFEIPTGIGKTAVFVGIVSAAQKAAEKDGVELKTMVVAPTNNLVDQTKDAFELFAPSTTGNIGIYDGRTKNLKEIFTITTYDSWFDLTAQGKIGSHNVDILISDEAHRGTSERRIEAIDGSFDDARTAQIAFTATADFDEEKSVEASHERRVYHKSLANAIRGGELAPYIQSQRYIIRAEVPEDIEEQFNEATSNDNRQYKRRIKQAAWNKRVHIIYREGVDKRTGDLLSDNQAGFFVDGIAQADKLEELLNNDPVLQARAKAQGRKGVALAIHSDLPAKEQKRRFKAYERGEYMSIIGDQKFKEGFDHPPMKSLFDYQRGSLVDKVQVLGRGARKWWNELKARNEGMTIIDTVIYVGSRDKDENEKARNEALCNAVSVKSILNDSYILQEAPDDDEFGTPNPTGGGGGGTPLLFLDDPDVEEYTTLEDLYELEEEVSDIRAKVEANQRDFSDYIEITDIIHNEFKGYVAKTGIGGHALFEKYDDWPDGLERGVAVNLTAGLKRAQTIRESYLIAIRDKYLNLPEDEYIVTVDTEKMRAEFKRTGVGGRAVYNKMANTPDGLSIQIAKRIVSGNLVTAQQNHLTEIFKVYATLPDKSLDGKIVKITASKQSKMQAEAKRTGMGGYTLFKTIKKPPQGLTAPIADNVVRGNHKTASDVHVKAILAAYKKQKTTKIRLVTSTERAKLHSEKERTGLAGQALFKTMTNPPKGLDAQKCSSIQRTAKSANGDHIDAIIKAYAALPDKGAKPSTLNNGPSL